VPRVALGWGDCDPDNPKNRRRRCSLLVKRVDAHGHKTRVLVDCSPDLRQQLLDAEIDWLDGVLITTSTPTTPTASTICGRCSSRNAGGSISS